MRFMTLTLEHIYMSGFLFISLKYEIDIVPIQLISRATQVEIVANLLVCQISNENKYFVSYEKSLTGVITTFS